MPHVTAPPKRTKYKSREKGESHAIALVIAKGHRAAVQRATLPPFPFSLIPLVDTPSAGDIYVLAASAQVAQLPTMLSR